MAERWLRKAVRTSSRVLVDRDSLSSSPPVSDSTAVPAASGGLGSSVMTAVTAAASVAAAGLGVWWLWSGSDGDRGGNRLAGGRGRDARTYRGRQSKKGGGRGARSGGGGGDDVHGRHGDAMRATGRGGDDAGEDLYIGPHDRLSLRNPLNRQQATELATALADCVAHACGVIPAQASGSWELPQRRHVLDGTVADPTLVFLSYFVGVLLRDSFGTFLRLDWVREADDGAVRRLTDTLSRAGYMFPFSLVGFGTTKAGALSLLRDMAKWRAAHPNLWPALEEASAEGGGEADEELGKGEAMAEDHDHPALDASDVAVDAALGALEGRCALHESGTRIGLDAADHKAARRIQEEVCGIDESLLQFAPVLKKHGVYSSSEFILALAPYEHDADVAAWENIAFGVGHSPEDDGAF